MSRSGHNSRAPAFGANTIRTRWTDSPDLAIAVAPDWALAMAAAFPHVALEEFRIEPESPEALGAYAGACVRLPDIDGVRSFTFYLAAI